MNPREAVDGDSETHLLFDKKSTATVRLVFPTAVTFDRAVSMEWLAAGQKIRRYQIRAMQNGRWQTLVSGTTIGHKKIDIFRPTRAAHVELRIDASLGSPAISEFQLYNGSR